MNIIVCLDDRGGMLFNSRRQSQDRILSQRVLEMSSDSILWMDEYTKGIFPDDKPNIMVDENFLELASDGEFCFIERADYIRYIEKIEKMIIYRWNRTYPFDRRFDFPLTDWVLSEITEFQGSSHERITEEVYTR